MTKSSILGCGWLGIPLAKALLENGFLVNGSTTSPDKISVLENIGISPFLISLHENGIVGKIDLFLQDSTILIIDIPPKLPGADNENFVAKIKTLVPYIEKSVIEKVIFISSTAVYADDNSAVSEQTQPQPETESGRQLVEAELLLRQNLNFKTTIVRFGGLIGEDRHPIKHLAGRKDLENPNAPVNLIHQKDCIGIVLKIIEKDMWKETFNAVAPFHPTRKAYYTQKALDLGLAMPEFEELKNSIGKIISSEKVETVLEYRFTMKL
jgi:nucleoside-diphosphate-sugar epimerase